MSFRERRANAEFKGVPFFVDSAAATKGRRVSVRRLAGQDGSSQQDLGREPDEFDVEAFVVGDDYDLARDELEAALLEGGAGALVLPTRGDLWARVTRGPVVNETRRAQGICTIRFSVVVEDRAARGLRVSTDTAGKLKLAADALATAAETDFLDVFDVLGLPGKYITKAVTAVSTVTTALRQVMGKINGTLNPIEDLSASIDSFGEATSDLISTPAVLMSRLTGLTLSVFGLADTTSAAIDRVTGLKEAAATPYDAALAVRSSSLAARELNGLGDDSPEDGTTDLATQSAQNVRAVYRLARATALSAQANVYASAAFDSADLALEVIESMGDEIDALQALSATDDLFYALADLRATLTDHLTQTAVELPKTIQKDLRHEVPALLLAHTLYADARLDAEIVARNRPRYPLFLSGTLEVLEPEA